jgi:hypothetical protein
MKANTTPRIGGDPALARELREHAVLINLMANGLLAGTNNATTAAPTTETHAQGDFVRNSAPTEAGSEGSMYVVLGWICTVSGTPGTWVEARVLTGN